MELFSELYGKYYTLVQHILNLAHQDGITLNTIRKVVSEEGFLESPTSLIPSLIAQDKNSYHLLYKKEDKYYSILKNKPVSYFTNLENSWLKALLCDPKMNLFFEEDELFYLKSKLKEVDPLFEPDMFGSVQIADSCDFTDETYIKNFKTICNAIRNQQLLSITYTNEADEVICNTYALFKIEYQLKYDNFRLLALSISHNNFISLERIDLCRIIKIEISGVSPPYDEITAFVKASKAKEPVVFEVSDERNGFNRVFMYFSNYERISEFNDENNTCLVQLYYYPFDEEEIIRTLISFGPIIKVLSPSHVRNKIKEEIDKQYKLFANFFS